MIVNISQYKEQKKKENDRKTTQELVQCISRCIELLEPYKNTYSARTCTDQLKRHYKFLSIKLKEK